MTEQTQPTDAEILDAADDFRSQYKHGGTTFDEFNALGFARAVLAKWGTPAGAGELRDAVIAYRSASEELLRAQMETLAQLGTTSLPIEQSWVKPFDEALLAQEKMYAVLDATPQPTQAQAGAVPLTEARHLFDAGWKAAARFCDREDVVADGIIGFGACPQFEAAFTAAHGIKGADHA